jgi:ketosteroid isomerase-like protein
MKERSDSWPAFFEWLSSGAAFELQELHVIAAGDVAFCVRPAALRQARRVGGETGVPAAAHDGPA